MFRTTQWSMVSKAGRADDPAGTEALAQLCKVYWRPLAAFVKRTGRSTEDAQDMVQEFLAQFLNNDQLARADQSKGRFRSYLLGSLRRFLAHASRTARAQKRGGGLLPLSLELLNEEGVEFSSQETPERCEMDFDRSWAETVMESAVRNLRKEYTDLGKQILFEEIKPWLVKPGHAQEYSRAAETLDMTSSHVAVAVHRLRQRFREWVRQEVAATVESPLDVDDELRYLGAVLRRN